MRHQRFLELGALSLWASLCTLQERLAAFDAKAQAWEDYTHTPLGRLREELTQRRLAPCSTWRA